MAHRLVTTISWVRGYKGGFRVGVRVRVKGRVRVLSRVRRNNLAAWNKSQPPNIMDSDGEYGPQYSSTEVCIP